MGSGYKNRNRQGYSEAELQLLSEGGDGRKKANRQFRESAPSVFYTAATLSALTVLISLVTEARLYAPAPMPYMLFVAGIVWIRLLVNSGPLFLVPVLLNSYGIWAVRYALRYIQAKKVW